MKKSNCHSSPFFIVGSIRSGTTMLRLMLNSHPNLVVPYESDFIPTFYRKLPDYGDLSRRENATKLLKDISEHRWVKRGKLVEDTEKILSYPIVGYADLVTAIFVEYMKKNRKIRWGDKTPCYVTDIDILWKLFPRCRIVHLVRDGRDVALSIRSLEWGSRCIPRLARDWRWNTILGRKMGNLLGEHYLEIHYEDLVLKTEETLRTICDFLQEPYHDKMISYNLTAEKEMPREVMKIHKNSIMAPQANKVYAWKKRMSLADRTIFEQIAGDALELFGYDIENRSSTWSSRFRELYYGTIRRR